MAATSVATQSSSDKPVDVGAIAKRDVTLHRIATDAGVSIAQLRQIVAAYEENRDVLRGAE